MGATISDNDIQRTINQLRTKLARQEDAVKSTKAYLELLESMSRQTTRPDTLKK